MTHPGGVGTDRVHTLHCCHRLIGTRSRAAICPVVPCCWHSQRDGSVRVAATVLEPPTDQAAAISALATQPYMRAYAPAGKTHLLAPAVYRRVAKAQSLCNLRIGCAVIEHRFDLSMGATQF